MADGEEVVVMELELGGWDLKKAKFAASAAKIFFSHIQKQQQQQQQRLQWSNTLSLLFKPIKADCDRLQQQQQQHPHSATPPYELLDTLLCLVSMVAANPVIAAYLRVWDQHFHSLFASTSASSASRSATDRQQTQTQTQKPTVLSFMHKCIGFATRERPKLVQQPFGFEVFIVLTYMCKRYPKLVVPTLFHRDNNFWIQRFIGEEQGETLHMQALGWSQLLTEVLCHYRSVVMMNVLEGEWTHNNSTINNDNNTTNDHHIRSLVIACPCLLLLQSCRKPKQQQQQEQHMEYISKDVLVSQWRKWIPAQISREFLLQLAVIYPCRMELAHLVTAPLKQQRSQQQQVCLEVESLIQGHQRLFCSFADEVVTKWKLHSHQSLFTASRLLNKERATTTTTTTTTTTAAAKTHPCVVMRPYNYIDVFLSQDWSSSDTCRAFQTSAFFASLLCTRGYGVQSIHKTWGVSVHRNCCVASCRLYNDVLGLQHTLLGPAVDRLRANMPSAVWNSISSNPMSLHACEALLFRCLTSRTSSSSLDAISEWICDLAVMCSVSTIDNVIGWVVQTMQSQEKTRHVMQNLQVLLDKPCRKYIVGALSNSTVFAAILPLVYNHLASAKTNDQGDDCELVVGVLQSLDCCTLSTNMPLLVPILNSIIAYSAAMLPCSDRMVYVLCGLVKDILAQLSRSPLSRSVSSSTTQLDMQVIGRLLLQAIVVLPTAPTTGQQQQQQQQSTATEQPRKLVLQARKRPQRWWLPDTKVAEDKTAPKTQEFDQSPMSGLTGCMENRAQRLASWSPSRTGINPSTLLGSKVLLSLQKKGREHSPSSSFAQRCAEVGDTVLATLTSVLINPKLYDADACLNELEEMITRTLAYPLPTFVDHMDGLDNTGEIQDHTYGIVKVFKACPELFTVIHRCVSLLKQGRMLSTTSSPSTPVSTMLSERLQRIILSTLMGTIQLWWTCGTVSPVEPTRKLYDHLSLSTLSLLECIYGLQWPMSEFNSLIPYVRPQDACHLLREVLHLLYFPKFWQLDLEHMLSPKPRPKLQNATSAPSLAPVRTQQSPTASPSPPSSSHLSPPNKDASSNRGRGQTKRSIVLEESKLQTPPGPRAKRNKYPSSSSSSSSSSGSTMPSVDIHAEKRPRPLPEEVVAMFRAVVVHNVGRIPQSITVRLLQHKHFDSQSTTKKMQSKIKKK